MSFPILTHNIYENNLESICDTPPRKFAHMYTVDACIPSGFNLGKVSFYNQYTHQVTEIGICFYLIILRQYSTKIGLL